MGKQIADCLKPTGGLVCVVRNRFLHANHRSSSKRTFVTLSKKGISP